MVGQDKPELLGDLFLHALEIVIREFDNLATLIAKNMVVMVLDVGVLVTGMAIGEMPNSDRRCAPKWKASLRGAMPDGWFHVDRRVKKPCHSIIGFTQEG